MTDSQRFAIMRFVMSANISERKAQSKTIVFVLASLNYRGY